MITVKETQQSDTDNSKPKKAAYKAWKTIRRKKHEAGGRLSKRLDEFITVNEITSIRHPSANSITPTPLTLNTLNGNKKLKKYDQTKNFVHG